MAPSQTKKPMNEKTKEALQRLSLYDTLCAKVMERLNWHWNDSDTEINDSEGNFVEWDYSDSIQIKPIASNGYTYTQVNAWGDGTIELQDTEGESLNWNDFPDSTILQVIEALG